MRTGRLQRLQDELKSRRRGPRANLGRTVRRRRRLARTAQLMANACTVQALGGSQRAAIYSSRNFYLWIISLFGGDAPYGAESR